MLVKKDRRLVFLLVLAISQFKEAELSVFALVCIQRLKYLTASFVKVVDFRAIFLNARVKVFKGLLIFGLRLWDARP